MKKSKLLSRIGLSVIVAPWLAVLCYYAYAAFFPEKTENGILFILTYGSMAGILCLLVGVPMLVRSLLYQKWEREEALGVSPSHRTMEQQQISPAAFFGIIILLLIVVVLFILPPDFVPTMRTLITFFPKVW